MAIAAGGTHSLALLRNNTVVAWGNNNYGQAQVPDNWTGVAAIAAGPTRSLALRLKQLKLLPPERLGDEYFQLTIENLDASSLEEERLPQISVFATTNLGLSLSNWVKLTNNLVLTNGRAFYFDTNTPLPDQKTYLLIERP